MVPEEAFLALLLTQAGAFFGDDDDNGPSNQPLCAPGKYTLADKCEDCQISRFQLNSGATYCENVRCPENSYAYGIAHTSPFTVCRACDAGKFNEKSGSFDPNDCVFPPTRSPTPAPTTDPCDRSGNAPYQPQECILQSARTSVDNRSCNGTFFNLDLHVRQNMSLVFVHEPANCVIGHNMDSFNNQTVSQCKALCANSSACVAFEYG